MGWLIGIGAVAIVGIAIAAGRDELRAFRATKNGDKLMLPGKPKRRDKARADAPDEAEGPVR